MFLNNLTVVIAAYNRPDSLLRLLDSLKKAKFKEDVIVNLIISIDYSEDTRVFEIAESFNWKQGNKQIIKHEKNLGLKAHILFCGDMTNEHDNIILLEDDLYLSRFFVDYCLKTIEQFSGDKKIAGISLYNHVYNETKKLPFDALKNSRSDVYFMQLPSSWGQIWTKSQWNDFKDWLKKNEDGKVSGIPSNIENWPSNSWKKLFTAYMVHQNKYFVYPFESLTTNFGDPGVNFWGKSTKYQSKLLDYEKNYCFVSFENSQAVYDAFCENVRLEKNIDLDKEICIDLYGCKTKTYAEYEYVLTTLPLDLEVYKSYSLELKPWELNIHKELKGNEIKLYKTNKRNVVINNLSRRENELRLLEFYYPGFDIQKTLPFILSISTYLSLYKKISKKIKIKLEEK